MLSFVCLIYCRKLLAYTIFKEENDNKVVKELKTPNNNTDTRIVINEADTTSMQNNYEHT